MWRAAQRSRAAPSPYECWPLNAGPTTSANPPLIVLEIALRRWALRRRRGDRGRELLVAAGDNPGGCAARRPRRPVRHPAPSLASSGRHADRHRLNRSGNRQANNAPHRGASRWSAVVDERSIAYHLPQGQGPTRDGPLGSNVTSHALGLSRCSSVAVSGPAPPTSTPTRAAPMAPQTAPSPRSIAPNCAYANSIEASTTTMPRRPATPGTDR